MGQQQPTALIGEPHVSGFAAGIQESDGVLGRESEYRLIGGAGLRPCEGGVDQGPAHGIVRYSPVVDIATPRGMGTVHRRELPNHLEEPCAQRRSRYHRIVVTMGFLPLGLRIIPRDEGRALLRRRFRIEDRQVVTHASLPAAKVRLIAAADRSSPSSRGRNHLHLSTPSETYFETDVLSPICMRIEFEAAENYDTARRHPGYN